MTPRIGVAGVLFLATFVGCPKPKTTAQDDAAQVAAALSASALASTAPPVPAGSFEGEIGFRIDDAKHGDTNEAVFKVRGSNVRFDSQNQVRGMAAVGIYDALQGTTTVLVDAQRSYMILDGGAREMPEGTWAVVKPGKRETVLGYECEAWEAKNALQKVTACVAKGLPYFDVRQMTGTGATGGWARSLRGTTFLPLRFSEYDERGNLVWRVETIKIDRRTLPASDFSVPAGYAQSSVGPQGNNPLRPGLPR